MGKGVILAALLGFALAAYLIFYVGIGSVLAAIAAVGWGGFAILCLYGAALFVLLGSAWFALVPSFARPHLGTFVWGRAVRDCASEILPFSQVGGMVIGVRAMMLRHVSGSLAFASTVVDVTVETIAQIAFVLAGLAVLLSRAPHSPSSRVLVDSLAIALAVATAGVAFFLLLQRRSLEILERWVTRVLPQAASQAVAVRRSIADIHASPLRLVVSLTIHLASWLATVGWAWIALRLIGRPLAFSSVLAIEAILYAIRSISFVVPSAIGVQEAAYAILGPLFGLPAPVAVAVSLLKRARDIVLGVPVLFAWQATEGGRALRASRAAARCMADE